jgi:hypothetical protein
MIYDCIIIQAYDEMAISIFMLLFCMYFLGMLREKKNFDGGAGADFIAMAIFILFVLLGVLFYHWINAIGKHVYWLFFPHRKSAPKRWAILYKKERKNRKLLPLDI